MHQSKGQKTLSGLIFYRAALAPPPWETPALKLGPHQLYLLWAHLSHSPVAAVCPSSPFRHHLPAGWVQMKVGPGSGVLPLASTPRGAQSSAAEGYGCGDVHQVVTQGLIDEGSDGVTGGLQGKNSHGVGVFTINNTSWTPQVRYPVSQHGIFEEMTPPFNLFQMNLHVYG